MCRLRHGRYLDVDEKIVLLYDPAAANDDCHSSLIVETAPPGINLFALLNLPNPPNVTDLESWKVILSTNGSAYRHFGQMIEVSFDVFD